MEAKASQEESTSTNEEHNGVKADSQEDVSAKEESTDYATAKSDEKLNEKQDDNGDCGDDKASVQNEERDSKSEKDYQIVKDGDNSNSAVKEDNTIPPAEKKSATAEGDHRVEENEVEEPAAGSDEERAHSEVDPMTESPADAEERAFKYREEIRRLVAERYRIREQLKRTLTNLRVEEKQRRSAEGQVSSSPTTVESEHGVGHKDKKESIKSADEAPEMTCSASRKRQRDEKDDAVSSARQETTGSQAEDGLAEDGTAANKRNSLPSKQQSTESTAAIGAEEEPHVEKRVSEKVMRSLILFLLSLGWRLMIE